MASHGTYAQYQQEYRAGSEPCDDCRAASRAYNAAHRAASPARRDTERRRARARGRALVRLAHRHMREFSDLFDQELASIEDLTSRPGSSTEGGSRG